MAKFPESGEFYLHPWLKPDTTAANFSTHKALCVCRISNGSVRLFNPFTVR